MNSRYIRQQKNTLLILVRMFCFVIEYFQRINWIIREITDLLLIFKKYLKIAIIITKQIMQKKQQKRK